VALVRVNMFDLLTRVVSWQQNGQMWFSNVNIKTKNLS